MDVGSLWAEALFGTAARHPAHDDLTAFKATMYPFYRHAPHLVLLDALLMEVTKYIESGGEKGIGRVIIDMPPRHGKTFTVSKSYPAWHIGRNPDNRMMLISYGQSLADKNSYAVRQLLKVDAYAGIFPGVRLAEDSQGMRAWNVNGYMGGADALGIRGGAAGKGAHLLIVDDPYKSRAEAESAVIRTGVREAFTDDLFTRLEPGGAVIIMHTRWHQDDLIGWILRNQTGWSHLRLPALAEDEDVLGRATGEPLWAERYPLWVLEDIKASVGPYGWASEYQQNPQPAEGGIFKRAWFDPPLYVALPCVKTVRYWDLAMSEKTSADYTAGVRMGRTADGIRLIDDVSRARVELPDLPAYLKDVMLHDGAGVHQYFENKGYQTRAMQTLLRDPQLREFVIRPVNVDTDKLTRALPFSARCAVDQVKLLRSNWNDAFVEELVAFPNAAHDDMVDAAAGAFLALEKNQVKIDVGVSRYA